LIAEVQMPSQAARFNSPLSTACTTWTSPLSDTTVLRLSEPYLLKIHMERGSADHVHREMVLRGPLLEQLVHQNPSLAV